MLFVKCSYLVGCHEVNVEISYSCQDELEFWERGSELLQVFQRLHISTIFYALVQIYIFNATFSRINGLNRTVRPALDPPESSLEE